MLLPFRNSQVLLFCIFIPQITLATQSNNEDVLKRRGYLNIGKGTEKPILTLNAPTGGWTLNQMLKIEGSCSDKTADPIYININGARYYTRNQNGNFSRSFPASKGKNNILIECKNKAGSTFIKRTIEAKIPSVGLKIILTNDTDGAYTDLHIYEPDTTHVYWLNTESESGGKFFLNREGDSFDQPGFGPYIYQNIKPLIGTYRIDANYWPGGAVQHTLGHLTIITNEGLSTQTKRDIYKPLAKPGETATLAYVTFKGNNQQPEIFVPNQDDPKKAPNISKNVALDSSENTNTEDYVIQLDKSNIISDLSLGSQADIPLKKKL